MKAVVFTLGCKVNDCESGSLLRGLSERGFEVSDELGYADLYILNTCAVTGEAEKKSRQAIARVQAFNPNAKIIVCGCAAENAPEKFAGRKNVFLVTGAKQKGKILQLFDSGESGVKVEVSDKEYDELPPPKSFKTRAFIKIQDGCNHFCSYCIIPYLRGRTRSRSMESAAEEIFNSPAQEVVITGIDISSYEDGGRDLADLLLAIKDCPKRIRLGSLEAGIVTERLLQAAKQVKNFAPHFHLSLQSGSDAVLKKMNRHYTGEEYFARTEAVRSYFPEAAVTTDIIVGFPTETEEDFEKTLEFADRVKFSQIHCFAYSRRSGTVAAKIPDLAPEIKKERLHRLLALARRLREEYEEKFIGKTLQFLCEEEKDGMFEGHSENYIRLYSERELHGLCSVLVQGKYRDGLKVVDARQADSLR